MRSFFSLPSTTVGKVSLVAGGLVALFLLKKVVHKCRASFGVKKYYKMRDQKLQEMKAGYEKLKQLHPHKYPPELVQKISRSTLSEL